MDGGAEYSARDGIAIITFNRPEQGNPIDHRTAHLVADMAGAAEADPAIGALIVTGAGDRAFCSGMDLKEAARMGASAIVPGHVVIPKIGFAGLTERHFTKPLVGAVNGAAVGGGCEIAFACDILIAAQHATFALPEVKRGLFAFSGGVQRAAKFMPRSEAMSMILSGNAMTAQRLYDLGIVSQLVPQGQVLARAVAFCTQMLGNSWFALKNAKALYELSLTLPLDDAFAIGNDTGFASFSHPDAQEGFAASVAARKPKS